MSQNKAYLITGANRGIGKALLESFLLRPSTTLIAAVRNPNSPTTLALQSLPTGPNSNLIVVKIDSRSETDAKEAVALLRAEHGIERLDVVIANAGVATYNKSGETPAEEMKEAFEVNTLGPLLLFQACLPLLQKSEQGGIFAAISSAAGSISAMEHVPLPNTAYGASKAALNFVVRKIHLEYPELCAFVMHPGWTQTEMGNAGANLAGLQQAPDLLEDVVRGVGEKIDTATRENIGGTFASFDGTKFDW